MFCSSLPPVRGLMSYLCYSCLFAYSGVQHILLFMVLCTLCYQFLWIVYFLRLLRYFLTFIRLVYPMLPVSLDCLFLTAPSVFSNVYLHKNLICSGFLYFIIWWRMDFKMIILSAPLVSSNSSGFCHLYIYMSSAIPTVYH